VYLAAVFLWPIAASAAEPDPQWQRELLFAGVSNAYHHAARDKQGAFRAGECMGFNRGYSIKRTKFRGKACLPDDAITAEELETYVVGWMENAPGFRQRKLCCCRGNGDGRKMALRKMTAAGLRRRDQRLSL